MITVLHLPKRLASRDETLTALVTSARFRFGEKVSASFVDFRFATLTFRFCCRFDVARRELLR